MHTILIVDDEAVIREGLQYLIDWETLGYRIAGFASNGNEACKKILNMVPDVVLMDIRMPGLSGIEVLERVRSRGYEGEIIILSGCAEFAYAQAAIMHNVCGYLTKPVDEAGLTELLRRADARIEKRISLQQTKDKYYDKLKQQVIIELLLGTGEPDAGQIAEYGLKSNVYQVVTYEKYDPKGPDRGYSFAQLLELSGLNPDVFDHVMINGADILLLKGEAAIHRFSDALTKYEGELKPQKNSPLDTLFIAYGQRVSEAGRIADSYQEAVRLMNRRFFCDEGVHVSEPMMAEDIARFHSVVDSAMLRAYTDKLTACMQAYNSTQIVQTLSQLKEELYFASENIRDIRLFLMELFLSVKETMNHLYANEDLPFASNGDVIKFVSEQYYIYEILLYFTEQFEAVMRALGGSTSKNVIDAIVSYIGHNYAANITLENIAPLFGYSASYLGKIFSRKMGENFNSYLDKVRINEAKEILKQESVRIYAVADKVGYRNVDYFHVKFKKQMGISPAEYRKKYAKGGVYNEIQ